ncbi:hypothetical protein K504DRAFT_390203 [Pleomassaria siparia CBS 279.74]|uniref:Phosphoglycerate mutase-like protein n=1 Tax=Pleomassaria siparia CBS 279.74 TaxID=1314801 RepID=A0A6G1JV29_9PLEO|nr:hypothetical protein K504DRAFT_390203 [Pleomassaria siparia CBS 279.74]
MANGPDVVIVARHGARLDAADKTWHLTSPTPYDPPLTYGGWSQSKALGQRIASLLHARDLELEKANALNADLAHLDFSPLDGRKDSKKRRHKIVIHSSPYLRCIQTSTAIAAGISQFQPPPPVVTLKTPHPAKNNNTLHGNSPLSRTPSSTSPAVRPVTVHEPAADPNLEVFPKPHVGPDKILLRIDAFLGEWLSPDYYEDITPPPNSTMMVAGAKADLLRRGDYIELQPNAIAHHTNNTKGHFPGGWAKSGTSSPVGNRKDTEDGAKPGLGSLAQALPLRERSGSQGSSGSHTSRMGSHKGTYTLSTAHKAPDHIYDPPVPSYAVSQSDPIPRGYTAHARDACIDVDFQWDSMRAPQDWGHGGEYGDEWSTMHKRFRKGLGGMMAWYREHGPMPPKDPIPGFTFKDDAPALHHHVTEPDPRVDDAPEEEEDLVLILVTHGAGCNAMLGAITNQPVLLDVGMASLSMAVKRQTAQKHLGPTFQRPASVVDAGMSDDYEMRLMASLDHLRPGVDPSKLPQNSSPAVVASPSLEYRRRFTNTGGSSPLDSPFTLPEPYRGPTNSALGSMRRSSASGNSSSRLLSSNLSSFTSPITTGLWSALRPPDSPNEGRRSPGHDFVLNFRDHIPNTSSTAATAGSTPPISAPSSDTTREKEDKEQDKHHHDEHDDVPPLPIKKGRTLSQSQPGLWGTHKPPASQQGLWGPPRLDEVYSHTPGPKRRWTVTESEFDG